jgi:DNA-binding PadR family transcriptional regulator
MATFAILKAIDQGYCHGFDIIDVTRLPGGTVYPALGRLETEGLLQSHWEDVRIAQEEGRPPRRYYQIRPAGKRALEEWVRHLRELEQLPASPRLKPRPKKA